MTIARAIDKRKECNSMPGGKSVCRLIRGELIAYSIELPSEILSEHGSVGKVAA